MTLSSWRERLAAGTGPIGSEADYARWQRSRDHRIECLRCCLHEWLDVTGAILTIAVELLTWRVRP